MFLKNVKEYNRIYLYVYVIKNTYILDELIIIFDKFNLQNFKDFLIVLKLI